MSQPTPAPTVSLRHGASLPRIGLGTWPMDDRAAERAVGLALQIGYRLVDTAEHYDNERGVGRGLRSSGLPREEVFLTSKFNLPWHGEELVLQACQRSIDRLGVDYLDLLLIHWPNPAQDRYVSAWRGLNKLLEAGRVRAIGTSNFKPHHLLRLLEATGTLPDVNQVQATPYAPRLDLHQFDTDHGIRTQSWSPLDGVGGGGHGEILTSPTVAALADEHGRSPAQIILRWHIQRGMSPVVKSSNPNRLRDNLSIFDFELSDENMLRLAALYSGDERNIIDSDTFGH